MIERCFRVSREEGVGLIAAGGLLDFFLAMPRASLYNRVVADVLQRMQEHFFIVDTDTDTDIDVDIDFHEEACLWSCGLALQQPA